MKTSVTAADLGTLLDLAVKNDKITAGIEMAKDWALAAEATILEQMDTISAFEAMKKGVAIRIADLEERARR